jgi:hypothetical protein
MWVPDWTRKKRETVTQNRLSAQHQSTQQFAEIVGRRMDAKTAHVPPVLRQEIGEVEKVRQIGGKS